MDEILRLANKYRGKGVLVDTNILLLCIVGLHQQSAIARHKRLREDYSIDDFQVLHRFLHGFRTIATTPHILAECSNWLSQIGDPLRSRIVKSFASQIPGYAEHDRPASKVAIDREFPRYGVTDTAIAQTEPGSLLVLTDDFGLLQLLVSRGVDVVNFNHLRDFRP
ncbi:MAG: hypothetical protein AAF288_03560 [Planctomycetota bacterium]